MYTQGTLEIKKNQEIKFHNENSETYKTLKMKMVKK